MHNGSNKEKVRTKDKPLPEWTNITKNNFCNQKQNPKNGNHWEMINYTIRGTIICYQCITSFRKHYQCSLINPERIHHWSLKVLHILLEMCETDDLKYYRTIACLFTIYKLTTCFLSHCAYDFRDTNRCHALEKKRLLKVYMVANINNW